MSRLKYHMTFLMNVPCFVYLVLQYSSVSFCLSGCLSVNPCPPICILMLLLYFDVVAVFYFRMLSQFAFNLSMNLELPKRSKPKKDFLREGLRDMLIKHHLFSWDL